MKVKFKDVICMGNKTYMAGEVSEFTDITGQQLIDKEYAVLAVKTDASDDESEAKVKTAKKTTTKAE
ncbi:hypothetical protein [Psychrobacter sp. 16-MNA-CIBAN-0192]|uniref:hypothetical protein n=1 Tax=Psychrobacter sp. 16-MNA-CIBAN-0192 TaxID=3140448 RepID=UPI00331FCEED